MAEIYVLASGAINYLKRKEKEMTKRVERIFKIRIKEAEALAKSNMQSGPLMAVDTGRAVNTISSKTGKEKTLVVGELSGGTDYFKFIELGTGDYAGDYKKGKPGEVGRPPSKGGMKARPVLNEALKEVFPKMKNELKGIAK